LDVIQVSDGSYLAVGSIEWNGAIWRSTDGIEWIEIPDGPPVDPQMSKGLGGVVQTADGFLAWGGGGLRYSEAGFSIIWTSSDGARWVERAVWEGFLLDVAVGGPGFVGVGSQVGLDNLYGALAWSSADGMTWVESPQVPGAGDAGMLGVIPYEGGFLAVGASRDQNGGADGMVWRSDDGIAWTEVPTETLGGAGLSDIMVSDGRLLAASWTTLHTMFGELDRIGIWISEDGSSWTRPYAPECCGQMLDIADSGSGLLALYRWYVPEGPDGVALLRSDSGERWDEVGTPQLEADIHWLRLQVVGGSLGVIGLGVRPIGNDEYQPILLLPPAGFLSP
jgi:hypothetical protein